MEASTPSSTTPDAAPLSLLPAPTGSVDAGRILAELMIESGFARRKSARDARSNAERAMESAQKNELRDMKEKAEKTYEAAQIDAWVKIGTGAVTLGATGAEYAGGLMRNGPLADAGRGTLTVMGNGGAKILDSTTALVSAGIKHEADRAELAEKTSQYAAESLKKIAEDAIDDERAAKESVRKALDLLKEYESAQSQAQAAAIHRV